MKEEKLLRVLCELMKNARQSDRAIAEKLHVSQPTVTRARAEVEKKYVREYTVIPDFANIGYEVMAITFVKVKQSFPRNEQEKVVERGRRWSQSQPNIIFSSACHGMGMNGVIISFHKTYSDYLEFTRKHRNEWGDVLSSYESVLISTKEGDIAKYLSFPCLTEDIEKQ
jgi:DNA-binding Lrp family transcriptional regulator